MSNQSDREGVLATAKAFGNTCWIVFLVFLILKLAHAVDWSWWWVVSPVLVSLGVSLLLFAAVGVMVAVAGRRR